MQFRRSLSQPRICFATNKYGALALIVCIVALMLNSGCAKRSRVRSAPARNVKIFRTEDGIASWYGDPYHGRAAASGEIYDMNRLTAAHKRLPFDTIVRVEHRATKQSVDVRIIDRGPFVEGRLIDVSREAARRIGLLTPGTGRVRVRVLQPPPAGERYAVRVGVFSSLENAAALRDRLESRYRVIVGQGSRAEAEAARSRLAADGFRDSIVFRRSP